MFLFYEACVSCCEKYQKKYVKKIGIFKNFFLKIPPPSPPHLVLSFLTLSLLKVKAQISRHVQQRR
jgi:hypothetical protein